MRSVNSCDGSGNPGGCPTLYAVETEDWEVMEQRPKPKKITPPGGPSDHLENLEWPISLYNRGRYPLGRDRALESDTDALDSVPPLYRNLYQQAMSGKSRKAAVRVYCLQCMGWSRKGVKECTAVECMLFLFRVIPR